MKRGRTSPRGSERGRRPGKKASNGRRSASKKALARSTALPTPVDAPERFYPSLAPEKETAIHLVADGQTLRDAGRLLGVSAATIWRWLQEPECGLALTIERERRCAEIRAGWGETVRTAGRTLLAVLRAGEGEESSAHHGKLALSVLEKSGYLPRSEEKEEGDRRRQQQIESFLVALDEIVRQEGLSPRDRR